MTHTDITHSEEYTDLLHDLSQRNDEATFNSWCCINKTNWTVEDEEGTPEETDRHVDEELAALRDADEATSDSLWHLLGDN